MNGFAQNFQIIGFKSQDEDFRASTGRKNVEFGIWNMKFFYLWAR
jgi:hypothetical protein